MYELIIPVVLIELLIAFRTLKAVEANYGARFVQNCMISTAVVICLCVFFGSVTLAAVVSMGIRGSFQLWAIVTVIASPDDSTLVNGAERAKAEAAKNKQ